MGRLSDRERRPTEVEAEARSLLTTLSLKEKIEQMSGSTSLVPGGLELMWAYNQRQLPAGANARLGIPAIRFNDGPRGVVVGQATCFPVAIARGASWGIELEEGRGDAIGVEARAQGYRPICRRLHQPAATPTKGAVDHSSLGNRS